MLQPDEADTYVPATQHSDTVRDFVRMTFQAAGIVLAVGGSGVLH
jgi:GDPmannose 4,6-dehydratase